MKRQHAVVHTVDGQRYFMMYAFSLEEAVAEFLYLWTGYTLDSVQAIWWEECRCNLFGDA